MMFALARQIPEANTGTQAGKWPKNDFMGVELTSKTLGLIGCGNIGSIVAESALGLRMKVVAFDPFLTSERDRQSVVKGKSVSVRVDLGGRRSIKKKRAVTIGGRCSRNKKKQKQE